MGKFKVYFRHDTFINVGKMLYDNFSYLDNTLVILGYNVGCNIKQFRNENPGYKIVIYQLEQLYGFKSRWYNPFSNNTTIISRTNHIKKCLNECDEIWDYDLDNIEFLKKEGFNKIIKHVPMQFSKSILKNIEPEFDVLFFGALNERRYNLLKEVDDKFRLKVLCQADDIKNYKDKFKHIQIGVFGNKIIPFLNNAKIILNIHYYDGLLQEQVRLFELLHYDKLIVSEKSRKNYFGDLIKEFDNKEEMIQNISEILKTESWKTHKTMEQFRNPKYKVGAIYNSFYGLNQIEKSIESIYDVVDTIIIVHQKIGFKGATEPKENQEILKRLEKIPKVKIEYYDFEIGKSVRQIVLEKRNIGLELCKTFGCDYIMPLDCDERYDSIQLRNEINKMYYNNIDTLYSPIKAYYYDENHYFNDTYYVPSVYKVDERIFRIGNSSVLCDPVRKMTEKNYKISEMSMHHYTYLIEDYEDKYKTKAMAVNGYSENTQKIYEYLKTWKEGMSGLVHINDLQSGGNLILKKVDLISLNKNEIKKESKSEIKEEPKIILKLDNSKLKINNNMGKTNTSNYNKTITIVTYGDVNSEISNKCLQSIKAQTNINKQDIILHDVKVLNIPKIIKELKTDYLMFLNKNDIISKNYISEMLKMFDIHTGLVYCPIQKFENVIEFINPNKDRNTFIWKNPYINSSAVLSTNYLKILNIYDTITIEDLFFQLNNISKIKKSLATQYVRLNESNNLDLPNYFNTLIHKNVKLTTGLIYSNRLGEQFFHKWINSLIHDVQLLNNFSELIIINNSTIKLPINEYKKYFENIKVIKGTGNISKDKFSKDEYKQHLAEMLADSYNIIIEQSTGDLIHLREDDLISANNSFEKIYYTLIHNHKQENLLGVSGVYLNRYNPDINQKINRTSINKPTKLTKIGYTGTGYIIFWKELSPKFSAPEYKIKAHDWSWCDSVYKENKYLLMDIGANVQHWIEIDKFIQHNNEDIIPSLTYSKINR